MDVELPDGTIIRDIPEGTTRAQIEAKIGRSFGAQPEAAVTLGATLREIPRQLGLAGRYAAEGLAQTAEIGTEPIRALMESAGFPKSAPISQGVSRGLDAIRLPKPQNANERVIGDASRLVAGGGGMVRGARAATALPGIAGKVGGLLSQAPGLQAVSAAGAGGSAGSVREAGGGAGAQAVAGLLGGLAAPAAAGGIANVAGSASRFAKSLLPSAPQALDLQIEATLRRAGVDWAALGNDVKATLRQEAAQATRTGAELDPAALRRLTDFARVQGTVPTRGTLTLDPVQITREKNLAKTGANASDNGLQGLARVENENNRALINALNTAGAGEAQDAYATGQRVIGALQGDLDASRANVNNLYSAARDSSGRSFPLDGAAFANRAIADLSDNLLGGALPNDVRQHLNRISAGEVPFTVDYAEQLKTRIGNLQRASNDGSTRMALGMVRRALDETPVLPLGQQTPAAGARAVNPGNLPAVAGDASIGEDAISAFNQARAANRAMMGRIENTPALQAVYEGTASPDQFVNRFILGQGATANDVAALNTAARVDPQARTAVRNYVAQWLKDKALNGAADEVGNFSPSAYNKALQAIGNRKLSVFFDESEVEQLRAIGRVSSYINAQPKGSAVNNSNSGALIAGRGLDFLNALGGRLPLMNIGPQIQGIARGFQQSAAQRLAPALTVPQIRPGLPALPAAIYGGLLAPAGIPPGEDDRRP